MKLTFPASFFYLKQLKPGKNKCNMYLKKEQWNNVRILVELEN